MSFQAESWRRSKETKLKDQNTGFFSLCTGSQTGAKSSIFEHNSASLTVSPSSFPFKDLVAKGHSSFYFSSCTGSLEHTPVSGKLVASSLRGQHRCAPVASEVSDQAIFLEECRRDPEFRNRVLGLERMLRVKSQKETTINDVDNGIDSGLAAPTLRPYNESGGGVASAEAFEATSEVAVDEVSAQAFGVASVLDGGVASVEALEGTSDVVVDVASALASGVASVMDGSAASSEASERVWMVSWPFARRLEYDETVVEVGLRMRPQVTM